MITARFDTAPAIPERHPANQGLPDHQLSIGAWFSHRRARDGQGRSAIPARTLPLRAVPDRRASLRQRPALTGTVLDPLGLDRLAGRKAPPRPFTARNDEVEIEAAFGALSDRASDEGESVGGGGVHVGGLLFRYRQHRTDGPICQQLIFA